MQYIQSHSVPLCQANLFYLPALGQASGAFVFDSTLLETEPEGMRSATLSMTPPYDIVLFETKPESGYEVTSVGSGLAAGPISMMVLPDDNIIVSKTKPESDEEDTVVSLIYLITLELSLIANR